MHESRKRIKVTKNGRYIVSGKASMSEQIKTPNDEGDPYRWQIGKEHKTGNRFTLCRCGQSKNKPFCDGSHIPTKSDGTETAHQESYVEKAKTIEGSDLRLVDIEELCASARFCHRAGGIWKLTQESNSPGKKESYDCPSGRLVVRDKKTEKTLEPALEQSIGLVEDPQMGVSGSIWVRGCIPIESADGKSYSLPNRVTLCRCGRSSNKPFCDSSHYPEEHENEGTRSEQNR